MSIYGLVNGFVKVTGLPAAFFCFHSKIYFEDKPAQGRKIKGPAIIICNHTSVYDFAALMFVFFTGTLRCQMAEVLFKKKPLGAFLKALGGIYVDRNTKSMAFMLKSEEILDNGGIVEIFPESRLPLPGEDRPLEFKTSAAALALNCEVPVIPVYTDGCYFDFKKRAHIIIGRPVNLFDYYNEELSERENLINCTEKMRNKIIELGSLLEKVKSK